MPADDDCAGGENVKSSKRIQWAKGGIIKRNQMIKSEKGLPRTKDMDFWGGGNVLFRDGTGASGSFSRNGPKRRYVNRNAHQ